MRPALPALALLALALARPLPARSAQVEAPSSLAPHPLLLGSPSDPASPLRASLLERAASPAALAPDSSALSRVAEAILARAAAEPAAKDALFRAHPTLAATAVLGALAAASAAPRAEAPPPTAAAPALDWVFDGARPALELDGISGKPDALTHEGRPLEVIGRGTIGIVYAHPRVPGAVIKLTLNRRLMLSEQTLDETADEEEASLAALWAAGAAPRLLGRTTLAGRPASLREQVYGLTLADLVYGRGFGPREHALARALIRRLAQSRTAAQDFGLDNVMIGSTLVDPRRRALQVDAGPLVELDPAASPDRLEAEMLSTGIQLGQRRDESFGFVPVYGPPLGVLFDRALARSQAPAFAARLKAWFGRIRPKKP